jgi:hypothetical protein
MLKWQYTDILPVPQFDDTFEWKDSYPRVPLLLLQEKFCFWRSPQERTNLVISRIIPFNIFHAKNQP